MDNPSTEETASVRASKYGFFLVHTTPEIKNDDDTVLLGLVCVRLDRPIEGKPTHHRASFAWCSPFDLARYFNDKSEILELRGCKEICRRIADSRMTTSRVKASMEFDFEGSLFNTFEKALELAKKTPRPYKKHASKPRKIPLPFAPRWFIRAIKVEPCSSNGIKATV